MRYPASEKIEIIRLVEQSALSARKTLERLGVPRATFYRWYDQYRTGGPEALEDRPSRPSRVWIVSPRRSEAGSSSWLWSRRSYRLVNWRCGSPTPKATSYPKQRFTGSSKRMT